METKEKQAFSIDAYQALVVEAGTHVVQSKAGESIRVLATDRKGYSQSIIVLITQESGKEITSSCHPDGFFNLSKNPSLGDLVIVPKPPKPPVSLGWVVAVEKAPNNPLFLVRPTKELLLGYVEACGFSKMLSDPIEIFAKP